MIELAPVIELLLIALVVALITKQTRRPYTIALVIWGLVLGVLQVIAPIHLSKELVLTIFLPPLLFEGALHIKVHVLRKRAGIIGALAVGGTLLTAAIVGSAAHLLLGFDWLTGLLLGVIVAPTDPVSVLATFKAAHVDEELATIVEGESLFNDGIAVVLYVLLLEAIDGSSINPLTGIGEFALVVGGGALLGATLGRLSAYFLAIIDDHLLAVTSTLILAFGVFLVAERLHLSGVIAVGIGGLAVGNLALDKTALSARESIILFWEIVAFLVNSIIFLLIGFEISPPQLVDDLPFIAITIVVLYGARAIAAYGFGTLSHRRWNNVPVRWRHVVFWGGLRGAVPIALALGLPTGLEERSQLLSLVFGVVAFSLLIQGLTMPTLLRHLGLTRQNTVQVAFGDEFS